jgi:5-hydroxyisourate hydrolase
MGISTHVLDMVHGGPAVGIEVSLSRLNNNSYLKIGGGITDEKGRIAELAPNQEGTYCLEFFVGDYFKKRNAEAFFPKIAIYFVAKDESYHVPVLLSPFGFSTYRGC